MTHDQLVEKVARAIHDTDGMADTTWPASDNDDGYRGGSGYLRLCQWPELYREAARAAIAAVLAAIREPSDDMLRVQASPLLCIGSPEIKPVQDWRRGIFRSMIDASALAPASEANPA